MIAGPADVIEFLRIQARPFMFTAAAVPAAVGATLAAVRICRSAEGPELFARALENARYLHAGSSDLGFQVVKPTRLTDGQRGREATVVPVVVGDDWKAAFLWKALYEAGVFVNVALHPAVPPAGALLRTSVMATHDPCDARPGTRRVRPAQALLRVRARAAAFRRNRRSLPGRGATDRTRAERGRQTKDRPDG